MLLADQNSELLIAGIKVHLNHKTIKNIHLSVLPPDGRVRLSVPHGTGEQAIRLAVINKLTWIKNNKLILLINLVKLPVRWSAVKVIIYGVSNIAFQLLKQRENFS